MTSEHQENRALSTTEFATPGGLASWLEGWCDHENGELNGVECCPWREAALRVRVLGAEASPPNAETWRALTEWLKGKRDGEAVRAAANESLYFQGCSDMAAVVLALMDRLSAAGDPDSIWNEAAPAGVRRDALVAEIVRRSFPGPPPHRIAAAFRFDKIADLYYGPEPRFRSELSAAVAGFDVELNLLSAKAGE